MKLSILIFVLATIIYGYQCTPTPGWQENLKHDLDNMHQKLEADRQQRAENLKKFHEQLDAERQQREENLNQLHQQLEAERQQREENLNQLHKQLEADRKQREEKRKQFHEQLEAARQQREQTRAETPQITDTSGYTVIRNGDYSSTTTREIIYENLVEKTVEERKFNNFKIRTLIKNTPALNETEVQSYRCGLDVDSQCTLISIIRQDNDQFYCTN